MSPDCPRTHRDLLASASRVLGLQGWSTTVSLFSVLKKKKKSYISLHLLNSCATRAGHILCSTRSEVCQLQAWPADQPPMFSPATHPDGEGPPGTLGSEGNRHACGKKRGSLNVYVEQSLLIN
ncbi:rCG43563 [Rattus norvegicus]|uniref:RCG43563 n=1 Tax=Rattus norvegicus TaxID=10116 RepID=A6JIF8_RAT|nr:rCG43563 [Rattus norvegicus]